MLVRRFGRPGLLGLAARTAIVAGTAGAVTGAMRRHQEGEQIEEAEATRYEQQQAAASAPAASPAVDVVGQLERLGALRSQGVLTEAEFAAQKARLLAP